MVYIFCLDCREDLSDQLSSLQMRIAEVRAQAKRFGVRPLLYLMVSDDTREQQEAAPEFLALKEKGQFDAVEWVNFDDAECLYETCSVAAKDLRRLRMDSRTTLRWRSTFTLGKGSLLGRGNSES